MSEQEIKELSSKIEDKIDTLQQIYETRAPDFIQDMDQIQIKDILNDYGIELEIA